MRCRSFTMSGRPGEISPRRTGAMGRNKGSWLGYRSPRFGLSLPWTGLTAHGTGAGFGGGMGGAPESVGGG
jgi:hypothetical protein